MKIMICGKGGSGKSSITVLMARALSKNYEVYILDSDESNTLLPKMLGAKHSKPIVEYLGGKKSIFKQGEVNLVKALAKAGQGIELRSLPQEYLSTTLDRIKLITIGKVSSYEEGCACPFNFLTRTLLKNLLIKEDELVLVDTDAGMEYVGRAVIEGVDAFFGIANPTSESLVLLNKIKEIAFSLNKKFWLILNKITPEIVDRFQKKAKEIGFEVSGVVRFDRKVFNSCLEGGHLRAKIAQADVESLLKTLNFINGSIK